MGNGQQQELSSTQTLLLQIVPAALQAARIPAVAKKLFAALHDAYEDSKLTCTSHGEAQLKFLGSVLAKACVRNANYLDPSSSKDAMVVASYLEHYRRDQGDAWLEQIKSVAMATALPSSSSGSAEALPTVAEPPCFLSWIDSVVSGHQSSVASSSQQSAGINNASCGRTRIISRLFLTLFGKGAEASDAKARRSIDLEVIQILIEEGFDDPSVIRDELPVGISLPLMDLLHRSRSDPTMLALLNKSPKALSLVSREDLSKNISGPQVSSGRKHSAKSDSTSELPEPERTFDDIDKDGIVPLEQTSAMLFPNDNRIKEVGRMLRSSRPVFLNVPRSVEVSDHDFERLKQERLLLLCRRVLALPVGRGMLTMGNLGPVPAEPLPVPEISLVGRVPPTNASLALDITDAPPDLKVWPEFHNGVAAGLRLPLDEHSSDTISQITRTWIVFNRPTTNSIDGSARRPADETSQNQSHSHGGLLMALGLRGHLNSLEMTDIYDYLTKGNVTTTVGVLLGMAAK